MVAEAKCKSPSQNGALDCDYARFIVPIGSCAHARTQARDGGVSDCEFSLLFHLYSVDGESSASASYTNPLVTPLTFSTRSDLGFRNFFAGASDIASASRFYQGKRLDQTLDAPPAAFQAPLATADCPLKS